MRINSSTLWISWIIAIFFVWIVLGYFISLWGIVGNENEVNSVVNYANDWGDVSVRQYGYDFINPLLDCNIEWLSSRMKYIPFEKKALDRIQKEVIEKNPNTQFSVYFRNLDNGPRFWINENAVFSPASLMKVPLLIAYYKWQETDPNLFGKTLKTLEIPIQVTQNVKPDDALKPNQEYTIDELLHHLIISSDNIASYTLAEYIPDDFMHRVNSDLWIPLPTDPSNLGEDYISVKDYASFFRILYNASYLNRKSSEEALRLLSDSDYNDGIKKFLPKWIVVSHKFWERKIIAPNGTIDQLHDCGIVYYTKYPYLLCIMTKGDKKLHDLAPIIQNTSKIIYEEVSGNYK